MVSDEKYDGVIFTGTSSSLITGSSAFFTRPIGAYRIRTVAAQHGFKLKVIDFSDCISEQYILRVLDRYVHEDTLMVGISSTFLSWDTMDLLTGSNVVERVKKLSKSKAKIVLGGASANRYENKSIDWYVTGYADSAIVNLLKKLNGESVQLKFERWSNGLLIDANRDYEYKDTENLDTIWLEEDQILPHESLPIEIARGCIFRCSFCAYPLNGKKKFDYIRSAENIQKEFLRNFEMFGVRHYGFMDDTFNDSEFKMNLMHEAITGLDFDIRFCAYIKPELLGNWPHHADLLNEMGIEGASMGIESLNPRARRLIRKGPNLEKMFSSIERLKSDRAKPVGIQGNFIVGLPEESRESVISTHQWTLESGLVDRASWQPLYILKQNPKYYLSEIDLDPQKYGYELMGDAGPGGFYDWKNEHFTRTEAFNLAKYFQQENNKVSRLGGWEGHQLRQFKVINFDRLMRSSNERYPPSVMNVSACKKR